MATNIQSIKKFEIDTRYYRGLASFFSVPTIKRIISSNGIPISLKYILDYSNYIKHVSRSIVLSQFFEGLFNFLFQNYRNEYLYKNIIATKLAIDKHPRGSTTLLNEFRVNQSKADVVIVNGTSNVYEIKTEFDNFDRLEGQLNSYHYLFDKINVITHPLLVDKLFDTIDNGIGIHTLTESGEIKIIRSAASNIQNIDPVAVLNSLRKEEYLKVLEEEYGRDIKIPNTQVYEEARLLFTNYTPKKAHEKMVIILKNRGQQNSFSEFFGLLPESLNFIGLVGKFTKAEILILRELLPMKLRFT